MSIIARSSGAVSVSALAPSAREAGARLVRHIAGLKQLHKAGLTPFFGDVDELFDLAAALDYALGDLPSLPTTPRCARGPCTEDAVEAIGEQVYCRSCAASVRRLLRDIEAFGIRPVLAPWPRSGEGDSRVEAGR